MSNQNTSFMNIIDCTAMRNVTLCKQNDHYTPTIHIYQNMNEHDVVYILSGNIEIYQNDIPYFAEKDDLLFFHAHVPIYGKKPSSPDCSLMYLHITTSPLDSFVSAEEQYKVPENCISMPVLQSCKYHPNIKQLMRDIIQNSWVYTALQEKRNNALINLLLCEIAAIHSCDNQQWDSVAFDIMQRIHAAPSHFYKLEELAEIYGISTRTISTRFREASGYPVHQYQIHVKLELAFTMLREDSSIKVKDVALDLGFSDEFHFARLFKREFGYTPSEIRDNLDLKRRDTGFHTPFAGVLP